jgi:hypothetical protein
MRKLLWAVTLTAAMLPGLMAGDCENSVDEDEEEQELMEEQDPTDSSEDKPDE